MKNNKNNLLSVLAHSQEMNFIFNETNLIDRLAANGNIKLIEKIFEFSSDKKKYVNDIIRYYLTAPRYHKNQQINIENLIKNPSIKNHINLDYIIEIQQEKNKDSINVDFINDLFGLNKRYKLPIKLENIAQLGLRGMLRIIFDSMGVIHNQSQEEIRNQQMKFLAKITPEGKINEKSLNKIYVELNLGIKALNINSGKKLLLYFNSLYSLLKNNENINLEKYYNQNKLKNHILLFSMILLNIFNSRYYECNIDSKEEFDSFAKRTKDYNKIEEIIFKLLLWPIKKANNQKIDYQKIIEVLPLPIKDRLAPIIETEIIATAINKQDKNNLSKSKFIKI